MATANQFISICAGETATLVKRPREDSSVNDLLQYFLESEIKSTAKLYQEAGWRICFRNRHVHDSLHWLFGTLIA